MLWFLLLSTWYVHHREVIKLIRSCHFLTSDAGFRMLACIRITSRLVKTQVGGLHPQGFWPHISRARSSWRFQRVPSQRCCRTLWGQVLFCDIPAFNMLWLNYDRAKSELLLQSASAPLSDYNPLYFPFSLHACPARRPWVSQLLLSLRALARTIAFSWNALSSWVHGLLFF